jgi:site-specific recombinase XerD
MRPPIPMSHLTDAPNPERRFRFMEIVRRKLRERRYSRRTEEAYVHWIRRYIVYNDRRHPRDLAEPEVKRFLSALAVEEGVAASTQNQALAALTFLYDRARFCAALMYGSGLRLRECLTLRVKDVDLERREIVVRDGKGGKDRRTPLADRCVAPLQRVLEEERARAQKDRRIDVRTTELFRR